MLDELRREVAAGFERPHEVHLMQVSVYKRCHAILLPECPLWYESFVAVGILRQILAKELEKAINRLGLGIVH